MIVIDWLHLIKLDNAFVWIVWFKRVNLPIYLHTNAYNLRLLLFIKEFRNKMHFTKWYRQKCKKVLNSADNKYLLNLFLIWFKFEFDLSQMEWMNIFSNARIMTSTKPIFTLCEQTALYVHRSHWKCNLKANRKSNFLLSNLNALGLLYLLNVASFRINIYINLNAGWFGSYTRR